MKLDAYELASRYFLAPMAGVSEQPFRVLAFELGAGLCTSELVSAQGLFHINARTLTYLRYSPAVERPFSLQLFGGEPEVMGRAAAIAKEHGAQIIDLNMGCPVKKVTRTGAGSALLCDPTRAAEVVRAVHAATGLPVTAKIRSGWDDRSKNYLEVAEALVGAGAKAIACHARTRAQGYSGQADWRVIADLKRHLSGRALVIGNGDVRSVEDARRMTEETGCDAVMIGRWALGNPWVFRELLGGPKPSAEERRTLMLRHFREHLAFRAHARGEASPTVRDVHGFRNHLGWYVHGLPGASQFRAKANQLHLVEEVEGLIHSFFEGLPEDGGLITVEADDIDYRTAFG